MSELIDSHLKDAERYHKVGANLSTAVSIEAALVAAHACPDESERITVTVEKFVGSSKFFAKAAKEADENLRRARHFMAHPTNMEREEIGLLITLISEAYALFCLVDRLNIELQIDQLNVTLDELKEMTDNFTDHDFCRELKFLRSNGFVPLPSPLRVSESS